MTDCKELLVLCNKCNQLVIVKIDENYKYKEARLISDFCSHCKPKYINKCINYGEDVNEKK